MPTAIYNPVDLRDPIRDICARLGLDHEVVGCLTITPAELVADVFLLNEDGSKYVGEDGFAAQEQKRYKIRS